MINRFRSPSFRNPALLGLAWISLALAFAGRPVLADDQPVTATIGADGIQRLTMTLTNYAYTPSHVVVRAGTPVELTLISEAGFTPHDFVIDDPESGLAVRANAKDGEARVITFTPERPGTFVFYCSKKAPFMASHRAKGMEGRLEVREE